MGACAPLTARLLSHLGSELDAATWILLVCQMNEFLGNLLFEIELRIKLLQ